MSTRFLGKLAFPEISFICTLVIHLYTQKEFNDAKSRQLLPLKCKICQKTFYRAKNKIQNQLKGIAAGCKYCSKKCFHIGKKNGIICKCTQCEKQVYKRPKILSKIKHPFCSISCAATYNNTHKTFGFTRSKLEKYIEKKLTLIYPKLEVKYNKTDAINSQLDIYIPSLKFAVELNGPIHYEPIFGQEKLNQTKNNDERKFQACLENKIELCIIDTSKPKNFSEKSGEKVLSMITEIIDKKLADNQVTQLIDVFPYKITPNGGK